MGEDPMIQLHDKDTGAPLGSITEAQLQFLIDQLEEESSKDQDYYINETTVDLFEQRGAEPALVRLLRGALKGRSEMEIRWSRS
jgi:processive 1,2-diacylglycerol beta-glucosyltransferase